MKLVDADKMREWLWKQTVSWVKVPARAVAYEDVVDYIDDHEYDEELIITHNEHGWFCTDGRDDIHGWDRESKQKAIALFHRRVKEKADAADQSRS